MSMSEMRELFDLLKENGIQIDTGFSDEEIAAVENLYEISFPKTLKDFYKEGMPSSESFINWRDFSERNIRYIKKLMGAVFSDIRENAKDLYWNDEWGAESCNVTDKEKIIADKLETAPKLIPIYSHRYMPMGISDNPPVISVHEIDVIYYGQDLFDYFRIEFGKKKQEDIDFENIERIPFWTELM